MLGKIVIFVVIAGAALAIFGRGARRGEESARREAEKRVDPVEAARRKVRAAKAQDLRPCPRCGAYVADPANCDCRGAREAEPTDMQR